MFDKYVAVVRLLRSIMTKCHDGIDLFAVQADTFATSTVGDYINRDIRELARIWPSELGTEHLGRISQLAADPNRDTFYEISMNVLPKLEDLADTYFQNQVVTDVGLTILGLLHRVVIDSAYAQFRAGQYRDSVLNAFLAVFDLLRNRTGLDLDGSSLVTQALSLDNPHLIFSELISESGKNEQKGFMQILQGVYLGIRNPKAHSLAHDLDQLKAAQYLVLASLLARRIEEAKSSAAA